MIVGLIVGGEPRDARLVQQLAEEHIRKESCIILLTIACESTPTFCPPSVISPHLCEQPTSRIKARIASQRVLTHRALGQSVFRFFTMYFRVANAGRAGVLTKPDRIPTGEESTWISKIQSGGKEGGIEYYSVKNPDSQDIRNGITYEKAREKEAEFFSTTAPWSDLEWLYKRCLGTDKLTRRLGQVLSDLISKRYVCITSKPLGLIQFVWY